MDPSFILSLDLGSSGLRALLAPVERPWAPVEGSTRRYRVFRSGGAESLARHFSPGELRHRVFDLVREGLQASEVRPQDVRAISITSQRQAVALLDGDGRTVYVGPNTDLRAVYEGAALDERLAGGIYMATGRLPSFFFTPAKLHWWQRHHPRVFRRVRRVLTLGSWVAYQLTGEQVDHPSLLNEAGLAGVHGHMPPALLAQMGMDISLLAPGVGEEATAGQLQREPAEEMGLPAGTPVVLAGPDTQAALLGMGVAAPGELGVVSGWSTPVQTVTSQPTLDDQRRTWAGYHLLPGKWVAEATAGDTGGTLEAIRRLLGPRAKGDRFDRLVIQSRLGANLATAFWGPHALDMANAGVVMGGLLAPAPITYNAIHAGHLARATMENIAYAVRECKERLETVTGSSPTHLSLSGGLARSAVFPQMLADVTGTPVRLHHYRASAIGAAVVASAPSREWEQAAKAVADKGALVSPDVRSVLEYGYLYERWLRLKARLDEMSEEL